MKLRDGIELRSLETSDALRARLRAGYSARALTIRCVICVAAGFVLGCIVQVAL